MIPFEVAATGAARAGRLLLPRGEVLTPCFMPVGTRGAVKTLDSNDLEQLGFGLILGNTYHLSLRPGAEKIAGAGGIHQFMSWQGSVLTDSGGFQAMSLKGKPDSDGITFKSVYDGQMLRLTPQNTVAYQTQIGSDIQMVLDVCPQLPAPDSEVVQAVKLTASWAKTARTEFLQTSAENRWQFGIVQGGTNCELRRQSAEQTVAVNFDGYAIGGLSVGEGRAERLQPLAVACENLPVDQPRYLMGVGDPLSLLDAISVGVDMFDCVLPTRLARHGTALTSTGRMNVKNSSFADDNLPLDPGFPKSPANRWSRAYLRHLLSVKEPTAARILTLHNLAWLRELMSRARQSIQQGRFSQLQAEIAANYDSAEKPLFSSKSGSV